MGRKQGSFVKYIVLLLCAALVFYYVQTHTGRDRAIAGIPQPKQTAASGGVEKQIGDYSVKFTFLYAYDIEALVLSAKDYSGTSFTGLLSNKDLALGWGVVAEKNLDVDFHWKQSSRRYYWQLNSDAEMKKVGGYDAIGLNSANTHLIPADDTIRRQVGRIRKGDHVRIKGYLVNADGQKGDSTYWWYSSTTREDTGDGSCEVVYVTSIEKLD